MSSDSKFILVHNGVVSNFHELKEVLEKEGYKFKTQTDTEVIVALVEKNLKKSKDLKKAVSKAFKKVQGRNTIVVMETGKNHLLGVKNGSPLVVGVKGKQFFISSDALSLLPYTSEVIMLSDLQAVEFSDNKLTFYDLKTQKVFTPKKEVINAKSYERSMGEFDSFYLKEVFEQGEAILNSTSYSAGDISGLIKGIKSAGTVYTVGSGTASYSASIGVLLLRKIAGIKTFGIEAYEADSYKYIFKRGDILFAVSQSGETADTLEAVEIAKSKGVKVASLVNMLASTLSRESDFAFFNRVGPEISVVSTKAFTSQLAFFYLLSKALIGELNKAKSEISSTSVKLKEMLNPKYLFEINNLAKKLAEKNDIYVLGKGNNHFIAKEGALKIKEISYLHAEGFSSGELKHGVIALIQKGTPVIGFVSNDAYEKDILSSLQEVKARGAFVIGVSPKNSDVFDVHIKVPDCGDLQPIANIIPIQLLGYSLAKIKGLSPDKPRNLAKSVTVK